MASSRELVWIVGDSHVFWLGRFVASTEVSFSNSLLECLDCQIGFHGYRGGPVPSLAANTDLKRKLAVEVPSVCVLSVGGNDLDHAGPPQTLLVGMRLYELAKELISMGVNRVVVCLVVRRQRWRHISYDEGSARVAEINEFLKAVCMDFPISFWAYKGFWNIQREIFRPDGVHFNDLGNHKLFRTIKGAVFTTVKSLRK